jgi:hypothetical protein
VTNQRGRGNVIGAGRAQGWFLTSGRRSGRIGAASGALCGRHGGRSSPASSGGDDSTRERAKVGEKKQGRESGCDRGSKGSWGTWAGDVVGFLGVHARGSAVVRGEDEADRLARRHREREVRVGGTVQR